MQIPLVTFFIIAAIAYMFFRENWIRTILIESRAAIIALMVELKNSIGQTLLRLERTEVKNLSLQVHQLMISRRADGLSHQVLEFDHEIYYRRQRFNQYCSNPNSTQKYICNL